MTAPELLPCPFCGMPARTYEFNGTAQAMCSSTFTACAGSDVGSPVAMWNRRTPSTEAAVMIEQARRDERERLRMSGLAAVAQLRHASDVSSTPGYAARLLQVAEYLANALKEETP